MITAIGTKCSKEKSAKKQSSASEKKRGSPGHPFLSRSFYAASLTMEAAFSLSLFLFCMIILMMPLFMVQHDIHASIQLEKRARSFAKYQYLRYYGLPELQWVQSGAADHAVNILNSLFTVDTLTEKGMSNVDLLFHSRVNMEQVHLELHYDQILPFSLLHGNRFAQEIVSHRRPFIGANGYRFGTPEDASGEEEEMVYISFTSRDVYHTNLNCSYLENDFIRVSPAEVDGTRSRYGGRIRPCKVCHPGMDDPVVYLTEASERYHRDPHCRAIHARKMKIPRSQAQAEGRHLCTRCRGGEG